MLFLTPLLACATPGPEVVASDYFQAVRELRPTLPVDPACPVDHPVARGVPAMTLGIPIDGPATLTEVARSRNNATYSYTVKGPVLSAGQAVKTKVLGIELSVDNVAIADMTQSGHLHLVRTTDGWKVACN